MFYDERIENVRGKIARSAILISFTVSFVLGGIHLANIIKNAPNNTYYWFALLDIVICIGSLLIAILGFIRSKITAIDERTQCERNIFYSKAVSLLIKFSLSVLAFLIPIVLYVGTPATFFDKDFDSIIRVLLFIVGIYVVYAFKKNDVYFNYSIMDNDRYYKCVFKNIGKLALYGLALLGISAICCIGIAAIKSPDTVKIVKILLDTAIYYIGAFIKVSLIYLLYSFLEKCSYNNENSISVSTIISLIIAIFIYVFYTAGVIFIDAQPISQQTGAQLVSTVSSLATYIRFALLIFLTYFGYEYQRARKNKLLSAGCVTILLGEMLYAFLSHIVTGLTFVFMPEIIQKDAHILNQFSTVIQHITDASKLANLFGFVLIIFSLVKDKCIHKANLFAISAFPVLGAFEIFLRTQADYLTVNIYHFIVEIVALCYFALLVVFIRKNGKKTAP